MKIFFNASIAGKEKYGKDYEVIIRALQELGHEIIHTHVTQGECITKDIKLRKKHQKYSSSIKNLLNKAEVMVVESSYPSISVGYLISIALYQHKPTLVLYQHNPHRLLVGDSSRFMTLKSYNPNNYPKLVATIHNFLEATRKKSLKFRFNLMLDETMNNILASKSRTYQISKADYIRQLIEKNLESEV